MGVFYKSTRIGKWGQPFTLYKIRTMREGPGPVSTSADDPRITRVGRILRKFKIDELPQLWNVLRGDMALVGPRPDVPEVIHMMTTEEKRVILSVKPGITDLASLWDFNEEERLAGSADPHAKYMSEIWPEKKRLQIEYVRTKSLWLNVKILTKTIWKIIKK